MARPHLLGRRNLPLSIGDTLSVVPTRNPCRKQATNPAWPTFLPDGAATA